MYVPGDVQQWLKVTCQVLDDVTCVVVRASYIAPRRVDSPINHRALEWWPSHLVTALERWPSHLVTGPQEGWPLYISFTDPRSTTFPREGTCLAVMPELVTCDCQRLRNGNSSPPSRRTPSGWLVHSPQ